MSFLRSPEYTTPVMNFIDDNCIVFDSDEESKLEFTAIHNKFIALVFEWVSAPNPTSCRVLTWVRPRSLIEGFLGEIGISQEAFAVECDNAMSKGGDSAFVYHQIMAVEDFASFKMVTQPPTPRTAVRLDHHCLDPVSSFNLSEESLLNLNPLQV